MPDPVYDVPANSSGTVHQSKKMKRFLLAITLLLVTVVLIALDSMSGFEVKPEYLTPLFPLNVAAIMWFFQGHDPAKGD